jgi:CBS domain-containing protein
MLFFSHIHCCGSIDNAAIQGGKPGPPGGPSGIAGKTLMKAQLIGGSMSNTKKVKELMIPLEDYPHIPYWFTLRQAMAIVREAAIKFEGSFEPRAVLVFDEKYQLMGMLTLRDIIKGLEPRFMHETALVKADPNLTVLMGDLFGPGMREASQKPVSEVMSPIKVTIAGSDPIAKAVFLMIQENVGMMPVIQDSKVAGMIRLSDLFTEISKLVLGE